MIDPKLGIFITRVLTASIEDSRPQAILNSIIPVALFTELNTNDSKRLQEIHEQFRRNQKDPKDSIDSKGMQTAKDSLRLPKEFKRFMKILLYPQPSLLDTQKNEKIEVSSVT